MNSHIAILETINEARAALRQAEKIDAGRNASGEGDIGDAGDFLADATSALGSDDLAHAAGAVSNALELLRGDQAAQAEDKAALADAIRLLAGIDWS